jgi:hypothetical protein
MNGWGRGRLRALHLVADLTTTQKKHQERAAMEELNEKTPAGQLRLLRKQ